MKTKLIRKVKPVLKPNPWRVEFHPCNSGVRIEINYFQKCSDDQLRFHLAQSAFLISKEQISAWSKL